jgi:hypothetical protein
VAAAGLLAGCLLLAVQFARLGWEPTALDVPARPV